MRWQAVLCKGGLGAGAAVLGLARGFEPPIWCFWNGEVVWRLHREDLECRCG